MSLLVVFGFPGTGKTFVGKILKKNFDFYFHDGDDDLTEKMKETIQASAPISEAMRDEFFERVASHVKELQKTHKHIVLSQTFLKERHRTFMLEQIPEAQFILIETETSLRESRLEKRVNYPLNKEYARQMCVDFDPPRIQHFTLTNNEDGEEKMREQLITLLSLLVHQ